MSSTWSASAGAVVIDERAQERQSSGTGGGARVVVLNDDHNTFDGVAGALARTLPGVDLTRGFAFADRIHRSGKAVVWSGELEPAELYWEQLHAYGLTMAPLERG